MYWSCCDVCEELWSWSTTEATGCLGHGKSERYVDSSGSVVAHTMDDEELDATMTWRVSVPVVALHPCTAQSSKDSDKAIVLHHTFT